MTGPSTGRLLQQQQQQRAIIHLRASGIWQFVSEMHSVIYSVKENSPLLKNPHKYLKKKKHLEKQMSEILHKQHGKTITVVDL